MSHDQTYAAKTVPAFMYRSFIAFNLIFLSLSLQATENTISNGVFENTQCIECHEKRNPKLIADWRNSSHASTQPVTDCVSCHGKKHNTVASSSRKNTRCINCHGGNKTPVVHSYALSKHGVLMKMEKNSYNWQLSLDMANYRSPGCAYCHMHQADHNVNTMVRDSLMEPAVAYDVESKTRQVCQNCHSPRYTRKLLANGEAMLEIARKKVREANEIISQASKKFDESKIQQARKLFKTMQHHLKNVYLGVAHQSPDYQWWHGQPALDGDLLRIKAEISELYKKPDK